MKLKGIFIGIFSLAVMIGAQAYAGELAYKATAKGSDEEKGILALFDKAMKASSKEDLEAVISLYSTKYLNAGYNRTDMTNSWKKIFNHFDKIEMHHNVYQIEVSTDGTRARMRCGGILSGLDTAGGSGLIASGNESVVIDSWSQSVHEFIKEDGQWKIYGNQVDFDIGQERHVLF